MENNKIEKIFIFFISALLLLGIIILRIKNTGGARSPVIFRSVERPVYSLLQVEREIAERMKVNVNAADPEDLERLPGVGPALAQKIHEYRSRHGDFMDEEELRNVSGIGPKKFEKMRGSVKLR